MLLSCSSALAEKHLVKTHISRPNWPFDIRRIPFFYGWVIWLFSTLGFLFSIPGQTMGMAVFTDQLIDVLGLSRTQLSMAYLFGTVGSALFLTRAGRWYDRLGGRRMIALASLALALMLVFISATDVLAGVFGGGVLVNFVFIMLGYFGVRFFGQGVLTSASRNVLLLWFEKRRGLVSSIRGVFVSFGFSLAPLGLAWLISLSGWRIALWQLALGCAVYALLAYIFLRDSPQSCGVHVDGYSDQNKPASDTEIVSYTLEQARKSPVFWVLSLSLSSHALFSTAVTFHIVSVFAEAGRSATEAFAYFLPSAIASTSVNLLAGWLADTRPLKSFLLAMLVAFIVGAWGLLHLDTQWGYWLLIAGFGTGGGLWSVISNLAFIRNFGPLHLGEISGLCSATMVFSSAIGPALFSVGLDLSGTYAAPEWLCLGGLVALLLVATVIPHKHEQFVR
ncbi:MAG: MFS transporter [Halieaceae bacterium]|jgi:MFS transporter, OFA family, oxalate/formate antiporter|nr:MFS transporter [Halieaceae bacterium]